MINRELIRIKVVQLVYAYYSNEDKTLEAAEEELLFSLSKAHDLYHTMLLLMLSIHHMGVRTIEMQQSRAIRLHHEYEPPKRFLNNRFIAQLKQNKQLKAFQDKQNSFWAEEEELLRSLFDQIVEQDFYQEYLLDETDSYEADRELWRKIYRNLLCNNEELDNILEDHSLYWNDDKVIVDTFVLKTIRQFDEMRGADSPLLPEFRTDDDRKFALTLFRTAILNESYYRQLISGQTQNWEIGRIAKMDLIIIQIALAEICNFPEVPVAVSINEYVELARDYSTPRSGSYINAMLDTIAHKLQDEHIIDKLANK